MTTAWRQEAAVPIKWPCSLGIWGSKFLKYQSWGEASPFEKGIHVIHVCKRVPIWLVLSLVISMGQWRLVQCQNFLRPKTCCWFYQVRLRGLTQVIRSADCEASPKNDPDSGNFGDFWFSPIYTVPGVDHRARQFQRRPPSKAGRTEGRLHIQGGSGYSS